MIDKLIKKFGLSEQVNVVNVPEGSNENSDESLPIITHAEKIFNTKAEDITENQELPF